VDKFVHSEQEREVFYVPVRFSRDVATIRDRLALELTAADFKVENRFPLAYSPHVTLGYFDGFDNPTPAQPNGAWEFDSVQVWGLSKKHDVDLGSYTSLLDAWGSLLDER
jgi:2'-5' RNA ligase